MAKYKSPGQKRKRIVRIIVFIIFCVVTYGGGELLKRVKSSELDWVESHKSVVATITELKTEEEEYRNMKGRKRYRDIYLASYRFSIDGNEYTSTVEVSSLAYAKLKQGGEINIWYANGDPDLNDTESNVESEIAGNTAAGNIGGVLPYTAPFSLILYWLLKIIFVRESKKALPEGFYTETSWLDIDDNYVVFLDGNDLVYFNIHHKQSSDVQEAYQKNASMEELQGISQSTKFKRVPLSEIKELTSNHNSDVINIEHGEDSHSVEFLNQTVKAHALERIRPFIPQTLKYSKKEKTRLQAAMPSTIMLAIFAGLIYYFDGYILNGILAFIAIVWIVPMIISRLIDPTVVEEWVTPETGKPE